MLKIKFPIGPKFLEHINKANARMHSLHYGNEYLEYKNSASQNRGFLCGVMLTMTLRKKCTGAGPGIWHTKNTVYARWARRRERSNKWMTKLETPAFEKTNEGMAEKWDSALIWPSCVQLKSMTASLHICKYGQGHNLNIITTLGSSKCFTWVHSF